MITKDGTLTFGQLIYKARKKKGLTRKQLASMVVKSESGAAISPQYLNDIEFDRRSPTSDHLIRKFAQALDVDEGALFVLAGKLPEDIRSKVKSEAQAGAAYLAFREKLSRK